MKKLLLMILDGWGEGNHDTSDVIYQSKTDFVKNLRQEPHWKYTKLHACGEHVGLPDGQMGNSEVGHLNIGAGRVIYQDFVKINKAVAENTISENAVLNEAFQYAKQKQVKVHYIGLVSDGGVHSSTKHLMKLCELGTSAGLQKQFIHVLTDGRDTDPYSGKGYIEELEEFLRGTSARIASVCGRYYTMDRDKRWERVKKGYDLMVYGTGNRFHSAEEAIRASYDAGITDEFIEPTVITDANGNPLALIEPDDVVICFNFRTDRLREITTVLTQKDMPEFGMHTIPLNYYTMTRYDEKFENIRIIFDNENVDQTLGEIIASAGLKQIRIAETEKYPHVTFFFSGGREEPFENERRILIQSPKVATYDLKPSMSAVEVKDAILPEINGRTAHFICLNFANADMVGHTGVYEAIREAVEAVDRCVAEIVPAAIRNEYSVMIIADHGNADYAVNEDGTPNTAHSLNMVPCFLYHPGSPELKQGGRLSNIAPTILQIMGLPVPEIMDESLLLS
jgi:2,3-bisphosphoglycerate-independent phosphoglycerate mutase